MPEKKIQNLTVLIISNWFQSGGAACSKITHASIYPHPTLTVAIVYFYIDIFIAAFTWQT